MRIVIKSPNVTEKPYERDGVKRVIREQWAFFESEPGIERPFKVSIGQKPAYAPGVYDLAPSSFRVSRFDGLELGYIDLTPVKPAVAAVPPAPPAKVG
ncbi:MAG: hypothetical protein JNK21_03500 [Rhodospirillaceae bacterium]|nr:hypothetical protein [Rhodospirillaceae bacterium]